MCIHAVVQKSSQTGFLLHSTATELAIKCKVLIQQYVAKLDKNYDGTSGEGRASRKAYRW